MTATPDIDGFVFIFHNGKLNSQVEAHSALDSLATCVVGSNKFEPFLNKLLDPSYNMTPLALELILSCKNSLRCDFTNADLFTSQGMRTTFCQLVADPLPATTQRFLFIIHGLHPYQVIFLPTFRMSFQSRSSGQATLLPFTC